MKKSTNKAGVRLFWEWSGAAHEVEVATACIALAFALNLLHNRHAVLCQKLRSEMIR